LDAIFDRAINADTSDADLLTYLEARLGARYAGARIAKETRVEAAKARAGLRAKLAPSHVFDTVVPWALRLSGMLVTGGVNACRIEVRRNPIALQGLPDAFDGFTILHLTDLHADISVGAMRALPGVIEGLDYDICVITGDFRGKTFGTHRRAMELIDDVLRDIAKPVYGVLGNHDPASMLPGLEAMGVRMLMNEAEPLARDQARLWIVGIDDPHFFKTDDLRAAMAAVPDGEMAVLLSHSADGYRDAERSGVGAFLCGHTHGGQICLPGGIPIVTSGRTPRRLASGPWRHGNMIGYTSRGVGTSAVAARFNCLPEVTLHTLRGR
jgi:predicted MPP superfamily phosphohydrolase